MRLFEFGDLPWLPKAIRNAITDLLRFGWEFGGLYKPIVPRLLDALAKTGNESILDLGSGGGGPVIAIYKELVRAGFKGRIRLSDKFPNLDAFSYARERTRGGIDFVEEPVDATAVPADLGGFRTMFATLHHFSPDMVRRILEDAVAHRCPIGIFDFNAPPAPPPPWMFLMNFPPGILLTTPFVRPFRWSRLFLTYIIPVVPFCLIWDALVSGPRLHSVPELQRIVASLPANDYVWEIGKEPFPHPITYLIGYPPPPKVGRRSRLPFSSLGEVKEGRAELL